MVRQTSRPSSQMAKAADDVAKLQDRMEKSKAKKKGVRPPMDPVARARAERRKLDERLRRGFVGTTRKERSAEIRNDTGMGRKPQNPFK